MNKITFKKKSENIGISLHDRSITGINFELNDKDKVRLTLEFVEGFDLIDGDCITRTLNAKVEFNNIYNYPSEVQFKILKIGYLEEVITSTDDGSEYIAYRSNLDDIEYKIYKMDDLDKINELMNNYELEVITDIYLHNRTIFQCIGNRCERLESDGVYELQVDIDIEHLDPNINFYYN